VTLKANYVKNVINDLVKRKQNCDVEKIKCQSLADGYDRESKELEKIIDILTQKFLTEN